MTHSLNLTAEALWRSSRELHVRGRVHNRGTENLFIVADSTRSDSTAGPYLHVSQESPRLLVVQFVLYEPSTKLLLYSDAAGANLVRLGPGDDRVFDVTVPFPSSETIPPYEVDGKAQNLGNPKKLQFEALSQVRVELGTLQASDELTRLIDKKVGGRVTGLDQVSIDGHSRTLYYLQCVIGTDVSIRNKSVGESGSAALLHESPHPGNNERE